MWVYKRMSFRGDYTPFLMAFALVFEKNITFLCQVLDLDSLL